MHLNSPIVDVTGRQIFTAGGSDAYSITDNYRGYWVSLEWFVGARSTEPVMMIQDAKHGHDAGMIGVCLSSIGAYADPDTPSNAAPGSIFRCAEHLPCLGKDKNAREARLLLDVILHFASALIAMPPTPRQVVLEAKGQALMDVEITHESTGKTHSEVSI